MEVSEELAAELEAERFGVDQLLLDIALRVDDNGSRTGLVSEQIGGVGRTAQVVLFQNHNNRPRGFRLPRWLFGLENDPQISAGRRQAGSASTGWGWRQRSALPCFGNAVIWVDVAESAGRITIHNPSAMSALLFTALLSSPATAESLS